MAANNVAVLTWNANSESDVAGYRVSYGSQYNGQYLVSGVLDVGNVLTTTFTTATFFYDGRWSFAVAAYDTSNNLSGYSSPVEKRIIRTPNRIIRRK